MMRSVRSGLLSAAVLCLLVPASASAQLATVRAWSGTLGFEVSQNQASTDTATTLKIAGEGRVTARDVVTPAGGPSAIWPNVPPTDPRANELMKSWTGSFSYDQTTVNKTGPDKGTETIKYQNQTQALEARIALSRSAGAKPPTGIADMFDQYTITIGLPQSLTAKCTSAGETRDCPVAPPRVNVAIPARAIDPRAGSMAGSWEGTVDGYTIKLSWTLGAVAAR